MEASSNWILYSGHSQFINCTEEQLFLHRNFFRVVVVVDAQQEDYLKGMCFIYGTNPIAFHVIRDGRAIRFAPTREHPMFAYQYSPSDLQLEYTPFVLTH